MQTMPANNCNQRLVECLAGTPADTEELLRDTF